ncbi:MAG: choice-of-anchor D domain-containing protein [Agitococcus sp.]|nr:choice-of-anchor D domain-containing protein [Agitococcus sp.]
MFNPSIPGYLASRLHLTSSASAEPTYVSLAGNGLQGLASYSSTSLLFAAQNVASTSDAQNVTITNDGTAPLTISGVHVDLGLANFNQNNNCAAPLGIGMSCAIAVAMTPSIAGPLTGRVLVSNNGSTGSGAISLSGSGLAIPATLGIFEVGDRQIGDAPSELVAPTSNSTGQWTYTSSNSGVVSMSGGTLTVVATGSAIITATQAANEKYTEGTRTTTTTVTLPLPNKIGDGISKVGACSAGQAGCAIMLPPPAGRISVVDSYEIYISNNSGWYLTTQASIGKSTGKWYWEATLKAHANGSYIYGCSVSPPEYSQYTLPGEGTNAPGYGYGADFGEGVGGVGTVYSCLLDLSSAQKTITSFRNGVRIGTHNISGSPLLYPSPTLYNQDRMKINLGQENFMYPVPLGYAAGVY